MAKNESNNSRRSTLFHVSSRRKGCDGGFFVVFFFFLSSGTDAARVDALNQIKSAAKRSDKTPGKSHFKYK